MKKLMNIVIFGSLFFIVSMRENNLYASERNFFTDTVRGRMMLDYPGSTLWGAYFIGSDFIRSLRGRNPYLLTIAGDRVNYFVNGELIKTVQKPLFQLRRRNIGALLLGYSFYKTHKERF